MPGATNFLQWNPNALNQETDTAYSGDSVRSGGAPANAIFASALANKAFYQWSIWIAAMANMMANKGYSPNDGSATPASALANLEAVLANIMTQVDMTPFALLASPNFTGTPTAPTPTVGDNTTKLATTAFVQSSLQPFNLPVPQRSILPAPVGLTANIQAAIINLAVTFPSAAGVYRADIRYGLWATIGPNVLATMVVDTLNNLPFAFCGQDANGLGYVGNAASEISSHTYAAGSVVNFTLYAMCNANATVTRQNGLLGLNPAPTTFLEVTPVLSQ